MARASRFISLACGTRRGFGRASHGLDANSLVELLSLLTRMPQPSPCEVCGYPVFNAKNHDVPAARAAKMFPAMICRCGKPARVRCFNGIGTYWVECEDGHGRSRPA